MLTAVLVWRQHPTEIEADLSEYHGRSIKEWHRGTMSSRELLVLVRHLKDGSAYKTALRDGKWPEFMQILADLHKEVSLLRGVHVSGDGEYELHRFVDPSEREALHLEQVEAQQFLDEATDDLYEMVGFT